MNIKTFIIFLSLSSPFIGIAQSLSGYVTDSATRRPIESASVYLPQLKLGSVTGQNGYYKINSLPRGIYDVQVQAHGYSTIIQQVNVSADVTLEFNPGISYSSLKQVVITGLGNVTNTQRSPEPVSIVTHDMILQGSFNTIIDAISTQPGVSETTEGVGTTKPQINGLGFNRVLVLTDGVPQEDFQWGDDHGILIDPYAIYDAELVRGPGSLQYGGSAEAGVVNFKTAPFVPSGTVQGSWLSEYHANNGYLGNSLHVGGNNHGFVYDLTLSGEIAHSYWNPKDGYVWGSAWNQGNGRFTIGVNKSWGYSRLSFSGLYRRIQVPNGNRDSTGKFIFDTPIGHQISPALSNFLSYDATIAGDKELEEYQIWWQNRLNVGSGQLALNIGFTTSVHHDIDSGTVGANNMIVYNVPYSLSYQLSNTEKHFKLTTGLNGTHELMNNLAAPPEPYVPDYLIPNYTKFETGAFVVLEKNIKALTLSGGLRYDLTHFVGQGMSLGSDGRIVPEGTAGSTVQFTAFNNTYTGWSGSIGASYQLPQSQYVKWNLSKSFRPPAINELTSNGLNIGSNAFQLGNINLRAEQGYQMDLAYGYNGRDISLELDGFYNHINHFIFADRTDSVLQGYPVFVFLSSNTAILTGLTAYLNIHPASVKWFEMNNRLSYIYTFIPNASDSTSHLPYIPAPHLHSEFRFKLNDRQGSLFKSTYFIIGAAKYWAQNNIYSAVYTELASAPYTLVNAGFGTDIANPKTGRVIFSFYANCTNLANIQYADHLNLAQYFYSLYGNLVTVTQPRQGIFNMGRDFTFKVVFPFGLKKPPAE